MIEKLIRGFFNLCRILLIRLRMGNRVSIPLIQPMRIRSQLMIQKGARRAEIGSNFKLETDAKVRVISGGELKIGNSCFINCNSYVTVLGKTSIGDGCVIGPGVMIFDHDHDYRNEGGIRSGKFIIGEITIGSGVWIGANSVILKGARIGDNAVVAAGSIVNGEVPADTVFVQKRHSELIYA